MKCEECKWDYPPHMLNIMRTNLTTFDGKIVCGICALRITNEMHRIVRTRFTGRQAEYCRQQAIRWRERNPDKQPIITPEEKNDAPRS